MSSTDLATLSDIFSKRVLRIPDYQRGFSWFTQQLDDLWGDLRYLPSERTHYMGVLSLDQIYLNKYQNKEEQMDWLIKKGYLLYYIVDGQQRLTALLILIKAIHAKMTYDDNLLYNENRRTIESKYFYQTPDKGITKTYLFGYEKNDPSNEYFKTQILGTDSTSDQKQTSVYTKNLCNAKEYFEKKIQDFNIQQLDDLYLKLTQKLTFNIHEIRDEYDSMVAFETLNNRGKSLSTLELLKNRLMAASCPS